MLLKRRYPSPHLCKLSHIMSAQRASVKASPECFAEESAVAHIRPSSSKGSGDGLLYGTGRGTLENYDRDASLNNFGSRTTHSRRHSRSSLWPIPSTDQEIAWCAVPPYPGGAMEIRSSHKESMDDGYRGLCPRTVPAGGGLLHLFELNGYPRDVPVATRQDPERHYKVVGEDSGILHCEVSAQVDCLLNGQKRQRREESTSERLVKERTRPGRNTRCRSEWTMNAHGLLNHLEGFPVAAQIQHTKTQAVENDRARSGWNISSRSAGSGWYIPITFSTTRSAASG
ncbi:hypothetical protein BS47DRAFT_1484388 [Hydnum rufescens UP504]|uniref:Uncharacterized protein n=1 Tax=Hydnum rufescens UP504 TaxID=1448309 RepID=A0A9P6B2H7_9AGAM|nr:hypothetical protein BS47DRAFT_1484388 [Hydnum rufescens UP504]